MTELLLLAEADTDVARVGGKAASLGRMLRAELPVPPGWVLTTSFFEPWFAAVRCSPAWKALAAAPSSEWQRLAEPVKALARELQLSEAQRATLSRIEGERFAVRSSSPEEDLAGASFAGGYETRLGVSPAQLDDAVRHCFASALDARVMHYKAQHSFDPFEPRIAVVIQQQLDADVAGVGFSLNPLTNDYDEAVFDAAWGLGESVVSGAITPDHFVVDRLSGEVLSKTLGDKASSLHLGAEGTVARAGFRAGELCLDDEQLRALSELIGRVEALFGMPVDIEWAWSGGQLQLLQARPISAWVPLPPELRTEPGEPRRLYMDLGLAGGLTINAPISPIGQSWMARFASLLISTTMGTLPFTLGPTDRLWFLAGGRMYQDLSNVLWLSSKRMLAAGQDKRDALMAATLANIDEARYRAPRRPVWASPWLIVLYLKALWSLRRLLLQALRTVLVPARARAHFDDAVARYRQEMASLPAELDPFELIEAKAERVIRHVFEVTMPGLMISMFGQSIAAWIIPQRLAALGERLTRGFEGNVVVEMGVALHRMRRLLSEDDVADPQHLSERLARGEVPEPFRAAWKRFVERYGWRGPHEVDLGKPRYADEPILALRQMCAMRGDFDPAAVHARHKRERHEAYRALMEQLGWLRRRVLARAYRWIDLFSGTRDTPKHDYLMLFAALRLRLLREGAALAAAGRLDRPQDVLELSLQDIRAARDDAALDLRARRADNSAFIEQLRQVVRAFPAVIDSRGRIIRPAPRQEQPGQLRGMPVSPGVIRGPVKVLRDPGDKPVEPGDVLVAHTTDPGWTPLFVNAAAVVLEVGGVLQHGAVVAREYGKPCVAGIPNLLARLQDGQRVEVDGTEGVVRIAQQDRAEG